MPYFIYKITSGSAGALKSLECLDKFQKFKQAKNRIREMRSEYENNERITLKMIFAENEFEAEQRLSTPRDAPILREWEK
jgi:hypothetical protein